MLDQWLGIFIKSAWEGNLSSEDVFVDTHWVFIVEGIDSGVHFINQDTESPPINGLSMALVENDFRGDVLRSTANGEGSAFIEDFGETKIS